MDKSLYHSTIKAYAAAISSCHKGFGDRQDFAHTCEAVLAGGQETMPTDACLFPAMGLDIGAQGLGE